MIALICDEANLERLQAVLCEFDTVQPFPDDIPLAFYLEAGNVCRLAVIAKDGARGMNYCSHVHDRKTLGATLWITEQEEFIHQSRRMGVSGFLVKPVSDDTLRETVGRILTQRIGGGSFHSRAQPQEEGEAMA